MTVVGSEDTATKEQMPASDSSDKKVFDSITEQTEIDPKDTSSKEAEEAAKLPGVNHSKFTGTTEINGEAYTAEDLVITSAEKSAFIDSLISGDRFKQRYDIFGGRVNIVLRNRTTEETQAMYAYMRHELSRQDRNVSLLEGDMSYILLVTQVDEMNGTKFPEMQAPMLFEEKDGKEVTPGWFEALKSWKNKPEGLTSAIIKQIQLFEYKYWTMVNEARNKNFWNSDTSIAG